MNLFRLLVLGLLAWLAWRFVQRWKLSIEPREAPPEPIALAPCRRCGVRVPSRSLSQDGRCGRCLDHV